MNVLLHRSHCSAAKLDGWSGAPGEGAYIRALCDLIAGSCRTLGITVTIVDGDLEDHPEFHADYDAFVAPHYDANVYGGIGGTFWGRASASLSGLQDDALGAAIWSHLRAIGSAPAEHFERLNVNVSDYYGFRLTTANTPGVLIELGVGAPGAPDYLWLRAYQQDIADAIALGLAQFAGITIAGIAEEDMTKDEVVQLLTDYGLIDKYKFPAAVKETEALYHHRHEDPTNASITTQPVIVPFDGAIFEGSSIVLPDGKVQEIAWMRPVGGDWEFYDSAGNKLA